MHIRNADTAPSSNRWETVSGGVSHPSHSLASVPENPSLSARDKAPTPGGTNATPPRNPACAVAASNKSMPAGNPSKTAKAAPVARDGLRTTDRGSAARAAGADYSLQSP